jgi:3-oxoacyl-[acyl-carrier-protein] synthase-1
VAGKVLITGVGIISSIGKNYDEVLHSLNCSQTGIGKLSILDTVYKDEIPVAEIKASDNELREIAGISTKIPFSRTSLIGLIAARQALNSACIDDVEKYRTGLISATTVGGMNRSEKFFSDFRKNNSHGHLRDIVTHELGNSTECIADNLGIRSFISTISTACSSSANAIMMASRLISAGILDRVVAGGSEVLTSFTLNGFNSLMILDRNGCRPFDEDRNGLTLGEGSGFLVIESEDVVARENKDPLCEIKGYGNACDAYHQTASSPEGKGAFLSMSKALQNSGLSPEDIDYINVHGTGTKNNDLSEGIAVERLFGSNVPRFSSTKGLTGHTLAAAGAIEAILSLMAIKHKCIWSSAGFRNKMPELNMSPEREILRNVHVRNVLSNSFGFGGNNTSLIFSEC